MSANTELRNELTAWFCTWSDLEAAVARQLIQFLVVSNRPIEEKALASISTKLGAFAESAARDFRRRIADINPNALAPPMMRHMMAEFAHDLDTFSARTDFSAVKALANALRLIRALSR